MTLDDVVRTVQDVSKDVITALDDSTGCYDDARTTKQDDATTR